jgi:multiple sugar transport system ATP-binding protein
VPAEIVTVEPTGSETQVVARYAGNEIMGAFRERITAKPGETLKIRPESGAVHLFDTESGKRIAAA